MRNHEKVVLPAEWTQGAECGRMRQSSQAFAIACSKVPANTEADRVIAGAASSVVIVQFVVFIWGTFSEFLVNCQQLSCFIFQSLLASLHGNGPAVPGNHEPKRQC